jgi:hypothetical protein
MATKKISQLTPLDPSANLELTFIPVFDDVSDTTRKITLKQINDAIEASIPVAESAYAQANIATTNAATADQKALSAGNYANSAFFRANNSLNVSVGGTITGDVTINGNVTVSGCTASFQVSTIRTNDPVLDLSFGTTGSPTQNAGIRILRGDELPVQVRWNESSDKWQFTNDGTTYTNLGEIAGVDNNFIIASFNTANTANISANFAYENSNASFLLANLNAQLSLANFNSIQAFGNGTGSIVVNGITANTLSFGGSAYANAAYSAANTADQKAVTSGDYANSAYVHSNSAYLHVNASYNLANTADQRAVTSGDYANSAFIAANTTISGADYANSAYTQANTATTNAATADQKVVTSGSYANAAYGAANTADQKAVTSSSYANAAYGAANTADQKAVTSSVYANSAYGQANTATTAAAQADQRAVTSGSYANSAYVEANSAVSGVIVTDQKAVTSGDYANSAYFLANVADQRAVTSGSYANSAFGVANSALTSTITTDVSMSGILKLEQVIEKWQNKVDATGTVDHDCSGGQLFYHTSPDANWTVNLTNLNLDSGYATTITLIIVQGGTGYYPNALQIGGASQTINWQNNTTPTPSTNRTDVVSFSIVNNSGTYTVLGQLTGF